MKHLSKTLNLSPLTKTVEFRRAQILARMRVPLSLRHCAFANYDVNYNNHASVVSEIKDLAQQRKWIIIGGVNNGIGKTHLATAAMVMSWNRVKDKEYWHRYVNMLSDGSRLWNMGKDRDVIVKDWLRMDCLLLDELGREPDGMKEIIYRIIGNAYDSGWGKSTSKQIIATTAMSKKNFQDKYDGFFIDRFNQCGKFIELDGKSYRSAAILGKPYRS